MSGSAAELLTVAETAQLLRVSTKTVRRMLARGDLVARRFNHNLVRVDGQSVMRLLGGFVSPDKAQMRGNNGVANERKWKAYFEAGRGYVVKYYDAAGRRRTHRIPPEEAIASLEQAEAYAATWYARNASASAMNSKLARESANVSSVRGVRGRFVTFEQFGRLWTSGELAKNYPDHVRAKRSANDDASRLRHHVYPVIGSQPIADFEGSRGLELVEGVLENLSDELSVATRRHVIQVINRVLGLAVYPGRLLQANPLPRNFIPRVKQTRAKSFLYSDEDAKLMACVHVPVVERLYYGLLSREGFRVSEVLALTWSDIDLDHGIVSLDENKTDDPRSWALDGGVISALKVWRTMVRGRSVELVLKSPDGEVPERVCSARRLRAHLRLAGVERPQLFEDSGARMPLRAHDLRATFVTLSLANGKTETFVMDRTGHKSSQMIALYRRAARSAVEARMAPLVPLDQAIPELRSGREGDVK